MKLPSADKGKIVLFKVKKYIKVKKIDASSF